MLLGGSTAQAGSEPENQEYEPRLSRGQGGYHLDYRLQCMGQCRNFGMHGRWPLWVCTQGILCLCGKSTNSYISFPWSTTLRTSSSTDDSGTSGYCFGGYLSLYITCEILPRHLYGCGSTLHCRQIEHVPPLAS